MADGSAGYDIGVAVDPEGILRSALEKIVFFECRVSQLESELAAAKAAAERARADAAEARRREVELGQALSAASSRRVSRRKADVQSRSMSRCSAARALHVRATDGGSRNRGRTILFRAA